MFLSKRYICDNVTLKITVSSYDHEDYTLSNFNRMVKSILNSILNNLGVDNIVDNVESSLYGVANISRNVNFKITLRKTNLKKLLKIEAIMYNFIMIFHDCLNFYSFKSTKLRSIELEAYILLNDCIKHVKHDFITNKYNSFKRTIKQNMLKKQRGKENE